MYWLPLVLLIPAILATSTAAAGDGPKQPGTTAQNRHPSIGVEQRTTKETFRRTTHPDAQWFPKAGLGLFIHWGISSVHGGIDLSWGMMANKPWDPDNRAVITPEEYYKLAQQFRPYRYDPDKWLRAAHEAGFRYAVMTARHHDGFALWPSDFGDLGVKQYLPGVDLVARFVQACRNNGLKVGLYYSPPDWYFNREYMSFNYGSTDQQRFPGRQHYNLRHEPIPAIPAKPQGFEEKYRAYVRGQIEELLTRYGKIDVIWFDGGPEVISIDEIRALQPGIVINPRMHGYGDFQTPECRMPDGPPEGWWELCDIWPNGPWGYTKSHESYKPAGWMLAQLTKVRSWGGNLLINVGPRPTGELPDVYYQRLGEVAAWMKHSGEAVFGVERGPYPERCNVPTTIRGRTWYLCTPPGFKDPVVASSVSRPTSVRLLRTGQEVPYSFENGKLRVDIPDEARTDLVDVVAIGFAA